MRPMGAGRMMATKETLSRGATGFLATRPASLGMAESCGTHAEAGWVNAAMIPRSSANPFKRPIAG